MDSLATRQWTGLRSDRKGVRMVQNWSNLTRFRAAVSELESGHLCRFERSLNTRHYTCAGASAHGPDGKRIWIDERRVKAHLAVHRNHCLTTVCNILDSKTIWDYVCRHFRGAHGQPSTTPDWRKFQTGRMHLEKDLYNSWFYEHHFFMISHHMTKTCSGLNIYIMNFIKPPWNHVKLH